MPSWAVGVVTFGAMLLVLLFWALLFFVPVMLARLFIPIPVVQEHLGRWLEFIAERWVASNHHLYRGLHGQSPQISMPDGLSRSKSYLLICNHQSWADILILFDLFHARTPFLRFFLKQQLIWVPLIGVVCWGLDMPFMKRHSREAIAANPDLRRQDLEATRRFCEKYRAKPITVVNFVEGTRFSPQKRAAKSSPYTHLLRPKSAGLSFTLNSMGDQFEGIIDVTLAYQPSPHSKLWSWLCGQQRTLGVNITMRELPQAMLDGDYDQDKGFRKGFRDWTNQIWAEKDQQLAQMQRHQQQHPWSSQPQAESQHDSAG
ncbi:MAG: acetyltransferase [Panacagrimonas sp.]